MEDHFVSLNDVLFQFGPVVAVFSLLALVTKRAALLDALRRCRREAITNVLLFAFNTLLIGPIFIVPALVLSETLGDYGLFPQLWQRLPEGLTLLLALVLIDFVAYWRHRVEHMQGIWRFHATHHADTAIHFLSVQRKHPVGKIISLLFDTLLVLALGFPAWAIAGAGILRSWWGYFIHADVNWTLGGFGEVLMSPAAHRLHHIRDEKLMGTNYGNTITLWDKLFGTYLNPKPYLGCETGIEEGTRGFLGELARPWEKRYRDGGTDVVEAEAKA
ncbi:sterol desaturase family protein [Erythrobacter mangrovi]|uniref:Sterol desaturase family protein n=1 Tax=Erythrobacter mangrovi TaxID=2739433 RepID=A0A7D4B8G5_9SPHN|nr:sterol desaturase family protein [Erythrobacter mangrovi]QKG71843.1 sterol desaturase family protein [Erythrobacter mangrovi]